MKTGIVKIPDEVKEAFKHATSMQLRCGGSVGIGILHFNGRKVLVNGITKDRMLNVHINDGQTFQIPESWIEIQEPEIDWSRVKVDAPIEASIEPNVFFFAHFAFNIKNSIAFYKDGGTSHSCNEDYYRTTHKTNARFPQGVNPEDYYV